MERLPIVAAGVWPGGVTIAAKLAFKPFFLGSSRGYADDPGAGDLREDFKPLCPAPPELSRPL